MRVEMNHEGTVGALWQACENWKGHAARFEQLADAGFSIGSRIEDDNASATHGDRSLAVGAYLRERTWNAARMLRSLHRQVFETEAGRLHLDSTVLYPLMRAVMEDATTITWLQAPDDRNDRLTRIFRALFTDSYYFTENHLLLASAAFSTDDVPEEVSNELSAHIRDEKAATRTHFEQLARLSGIDEVESTKKLATSEPVRLHYGKESVEFMTWKLLSDLSHFSFMMLRHLATSPIPGSDAFLRDATILHFAATINRLCGDALKLIERAAAAV